jgi:DNA-binding MarR family transcriptional regulator
MAASSAPHPTRAHAALAADPETAERAQAMAALAASFKGAMAAVRRLRGRDTQRPGKLGHAQYQLMFELSRSGGLPAGELALLADLSPASVTQMLDHLADAGLVQRTRSQADRRVVVSSLTDDGRELCQQRHARLEPLWWAALADFRSQDLSTAAAVLERLRDLFDSFDDPQPESESDHHAAIVVQPAE